MRQRLDPTESSQHLWLGTENIPERRRPCSLDITGSVPLDLGSVARALGPFVYRAAF